MSEVNSTPAKPRKRRSLWWLNLLLTLIVFAGGVVMGLKLNTMPQPYDLVSHYFPQLTEQFFADREERKTKTYAYTVRAIEEAKP